jgi:hypothetical protein
MPTRAYYFQLDAGNPGLDDQFYRLKAGRDYFSFKRSTTDAA